MDLDAIDRLERLPADQRREQQDQNLAGLVTRLGAIEDGYWADKLADIDTDAIRSLDDLGALPFTVKAEFRDNYPLGMLAVPAAETVRVHASSGTSGKPTIVAYTADDIGVFAETNARALLLAGASPDDIIHVAYGYGLFTGGLGLHYGVEALGATAVPASGGNTALQVQLLEDLGASGLAATPSFALLLAERAAADGALERLRVRYAVCGAEPWSAEMRDRLEAAWLASGVERFDACDIYGLSEIMGPGVAMECADAKGALTVFDDHYLPEVVDPATGDPVPDGEPGELVLTTLTKQAMPVLRYRTGDVTRFMTDPCPSGRTHRRIARLQGRVDDMLVIRGVNVFPREIEAVLLEHDRLATTYGIVVDRRATMVRLVVRCETRDEAAADDRDVLASALATALRDRLRLSAEVEVHPTGSLPRQETGKAVRVFDWTDQDPFPAA